MDILSSLLEESASSLEDILLFDESVLLFSCSVISGEFASRGAAVGRSTFTAGLSVGSLRPSLCTEDASVCTTFADRTATSEEGEGTIPNRVRTLCHSVSNGCFSVVLQ
jgi:hypothetical protein